MIPLLSTSGGDAIALLATNVTCHIASASSSAAGITVAPKKTSPPQSQSGEKRKPEDHNAGRSPKRPPTKKISTSAKKTPSLKSAYKAKDDAEREEKRLLIEEEIGKSGASGEKMSTKDICSKHGVVPSTYFRWQSKCIICMNPYKAEKNALFCINDPCHCAICFDCCLKMVTVKASSLCLTDLPCKFKCPLCNIEDNMNVDSAGKAFSDWIVRHVSQELPKLNKEVANRCMNISTYRFRNAKFMVTEVQELSTIQVRNITDLAEFVWKHVDVGREDKVSWKLRHLSKALGLLDRGAYPNTNQYETEIQLEAHHYKGMKLIFLDVGILFFRRSEELFSDMSSAEIKRRYPFFQTLRKIYDNRGQAIEGEPIDLALD
jgi:hypothetical protein